MSQMCLNHIGGIPEACAGTGGLTNPSTNSYKRLTLG